MTEVDLRGEAAVRRAELPPLESPVVRTIAPAKRRLRLSDVVRNPSVVRVLAARDFKVKYKQSLLGPLWLVFQPLALLAGFLVAFRALADVQSGVPYVVFALVGLTVWAFFQACMTIGTASLITNMMLVRFTPCPRIAFPLAAMIASLPSLAVTGVAALVAAAINGVVSPRVVLLPLGVVWLFLLTAGLVALVSSFTVRYRDTLSAMPFLLQVGLFLAPIGYPLSELGSTVRVLVDLNPLTGLVEGWRWMVISGYAPSFEPIAASLMETAILVTVGWLVFSRLETTMADEI
jgi:lipopolysaccharide transport system permease protein